jgi:hypothetical protein
MVLDFQIMKQIRLNGYADIKLENILGSGELLSIYWKSDGNDQKLLMPI